MRLREPIAESIGVSSLAALAGLVPHYVAFYVLHATLLTDHLSEWIMARTPASFTVAILHALGHWAKPSAETGALATLGFGLFLSRLAGNTGRGQRSTITASLCVGIVIAVAISWSSGYASTAGNLTFWIPALALVTLMPVDLPQRRPIEMMTHRRQLLLSIGRNALPVAMSSGVIAVAAESFLRDRMLGQRAETPADLFPFRPPADRLGFGAGLVRKAVTPTSEFYGMSKNAVDPVIDPRTWMLKLTIEGKVIRIFGYGDLLAMERSQRYVTLRCISNTLESDLMGTGQWTGVYLSQLLQRTALPSDILEVAFIGVEGHDDSLRLDYAYSPHTLLAFGMNGKTLSRTHGFPVRLLAPRYYGCRNVKWLREIRFVRKAYFGTWERLGYTNEPVIHTASHIDRMRRDGPLLEFGGVSFAGDRGIRAVRVRANGGPWQAAHVEPALSPYTWTRWVAQLHAPEGAHIEANAQDGCGAWQELAAGDPFPNGPSGPTIVVARV